jgi:hypothetical protein
VRDNVTARVWEIKPEPDQIVGNQGLHDADDTYTWYSTDPSGNGGEDGIPGRVPTCFNFQDGKRQSASWCNTEAYVKRVNEAGWCGFQDWRLPTVSELQSLQDLSVPAPGPMLDVDYFLDARGAAYWSAAPDAGDPRYIRTVDFGTGDTVAAPRYGKNLARLGVRLVRGGY